MHRLQGRSGRAVEAALTVQARALRTTCAAAAVSSRVGARRGATRESLMTLVLRTSVWEAGIIDSTAVQARCARAAAAAVVVVRQAVSTALLAITCLCLQLLCLNSTAYFKNNETHGRECIYLIIAAAARLQSTVLVCRITLSLDTETLDTAAPPAVLHCRCAYRSGLGPNVWQQGSRNHLNRFTVATMSCSLLRAVLVDSSFYDYCCLSWQLLCRHAQAPTRLPQPVIPGHQPISWH